MENMRETCWKCAKCVCFVRVHQIMTTLMWWHNFKTWTRDSGTMEISVRQNNTECKGTSDTVLRKAIKESMCHHLYFSVHLLDFSHSKDKWHLLQLERKKCV